MRYGLIVSLVEGDTPRVTDIFDTRPSLTADLMPHLREIAPEVEVGWLDMPGHGLVPPPSATLRFPVFEGGSWVEDGNEAERVAEVQAKGIMGMAQQRVLAAILADFECRLRHVATSSGLEEISSLPDCPAEHFDRDFLPAYWRALKSLLKAELRKG